MPFDKSHLGKMISSIEAIAIKHREATQSVATCVDRLTNVKFYRNNVIYVTPNGVALSPCQKYQIPPHYVENSFREGSYGELINGRFRERIRIDQATPAGLKGPNYSHYHLDGRGDHYSPSYGNKDTGFLP